MILLTLHFHLSFFLCGVQDDIGGDKDDTGSRPSRPSRRA